MHSGGTEEGEHKGGSRGAIGRRALMQVKMKTSTLCVGVGGKVQWGEDECLNHGTVVEILLQTKWIV